MTEEQTTEDVARQRTLNFAWGDHVVCYRPGRWVFALLLGVPLAMAGAAAVYFTYQEKFKASAWLEIKENAPYIIHKTQGQSRRFVGTQTQLIRSPFVLGEVLNDPGVKDLAELKEARDSGVDPLDWIREGLSVEAAGQQSELYMISFTSHTKEVAALIANAVRKAYYDLWQQEDVRRGQQVIELLERAREKHARDVERLRDTVRRMSKDATGVDPYAAPSERAAQSERTATLNDSRAELQAQLTNVIMERELLEMEIEAYGKMIDTTPIGKMPDDLELMDDRTDNDSPGPRRLEPDQPLKATGSVPPGRRPFSPYRPARPTMSPWFDLYQEKNASLRDSASLGGLVEDRVENDDFVLAIKRWINEKRLQLFEAETTANAANNEQAVRQLKAELEAAKEELDTVRRELRAQVTAQIKEEVLRKRHRTLAILLSTRDVAARTEKYLRDRYDEAFVAAKQYSGETVELAFQRAELARAEHTLDQIATRTAVFRTERDAPARVTPLGEVAVPGSPVEGFPIWRFTWVALAGLFLPSVLLMIWRTAAWLGCRRRNRTSPQAA